MILAEDFVQLMHEQNYFANTFSFFILIREVHAHFDQHFVCNQLFTTSFCWYTLKEFKKSQEKIFDVKKFD